MQLFLQNIKSMKNMIIWLAEKKISILNVAVDVDVDVVSVSKLYI